MGFWVAITKNGLSRRWVSPSMVTWRSSMHSSRLLCTFGGLRFISSASRMCVNTGPFSRLNSPVFILQTFVPVMSLGMRSGVNCILPHWQPVVRANTLARSVFPSPGLSSNSMCPLARLAASTFWSRVRSPAKYCWIVSSIWLVVSVSWLSCMVWPLFVLFWCLFVLTVWSLVLFFGVYWWVLWEKNFLVGICVNLCYFSLTKVYTKKRY